MKHVLSVLVRNQPGVLMRVAGMLSRRGFNIESLAVGVTHVQEYSRITLVMNGDDAAVKQVTKQLAKLVEVEAVTILPQHSLVSRGMAMLKVKCCESRMEILKIADVFRAHVIDVSTHSLILEITGCEDKITAFAEVLAPYGIMEMIRTGLIGLERAESTIYDLIADDKKQCRPDSELTGIQLTNQIQDPDSSIMAI